MENPDHPAHRPDLCSHASRVLTFKCKKTTSKALRWPHPDSFALTPTILASAGYFHNPDEREPDRTTCWMCGESTRDWQSSDDPWSVHLEWGQSYILRRQAYNALSLPLFQLLKPPTALLRASPSLTASVTHRYRRGPICCINRGVPLPIGFQEDS